MMDRRLFLASVTALSMAACNQSATQERAPESPKRFAVTMDDFTIPGDYKEAMARDAQIRAALPVRSAAFVSGKYETKEAFNDVVAAWAKDGHIIANHSYTHLNSSEEDTDVILKDIERNHALLSSRPGFEPYFRFPFLASGRDEVQKKAYRDWMSNAGYTNAPVTLDTYDWNVTGRLEKPGADIEKIGEYWINSVMTAADYTHELSLALGLIDLPHLMLVHHNELNALFLARLLKRMESEGWQMVDAKMAMDHPVMAGDPPKVKGWGNRLEVIRRSRGLTEPAFPKALEGFGTPAMDALGL